MAFDFVSHTDVNVFLTGKAGTGKTTFLHYLKRNLNKRMVVVAPTGVAAINAGAVTIHSFFQLPFGPYIPGARNMDNPYSLELQQRRIRREKRMILRRMELLIIDEVSMVRADILDAIDFVLREYRKNDRPFGGVQLLLIGDLHQLPPVLKDEEWRILAPYYSSIYFFSSLALQKTRTITIELKEIYRQSDPLFINLLEKIRMRKLDDEVYQALNSRFLPKFEPGENDGYIILTTHNATAHNINSEKLEKISEKSYFYTAQIEGEFPDYAYPTDYTLELKQGAQVMFVKNDPSPMKMYFNGKIGIIDRINDSGVIVRFPDEGNTCMVTVDEWENIRYDFDENTKEIKEELIGKFTQLPLKLAWAITIHKSQGLTFDKAVIDAGASFAHGQAYVALSRCRTFEGIVLLSPIGQRSIINDGTVSRFTEDARNNEPSENDLKSAQSEYERKLIIELFQFESLTRQIYKMHRFFEEHLFYLLPEITDNLKKLYEEYYLKIFEVSDKFITQLQNTSLNGMPSKNEALNERIKNAEIYFDQHIGNILTEIVEISRTEIDNGQLMADLTVLSDDIAFKTHVKHQCFKSLQNGFCIPDYLKSRANAELEYFEKNEDENRKSKKNHNAALLKNIEHPELFTMLKKWRADYAAENELVETKLLAQKSLIQICKDLPLNEKELKEIKGIGKQKLSETGHEILEVIRQYCERKNLGKTVNSEISIAKKGDTFQQSYRMYMLGYTVEQIAEERHMAVSTIEGHLIRFVENGDLDASRLINEDKLKEIQTALDEFNHLRLNDLREIMGVGFTYTELKVGMAIWKKKQIL